MKTTRLTHSTLGLLALIGGLAAGPATAQTLINVDFGAGTASPKTGFAATGQATNDVWNLYSHYAPKFTPGMKLVSDGGLKEPRFADGTPAAGVTLTVSNAPGVWGNATGDAMYDSYIFAQNGSNIVVAIRNLPTGRYHFFLYGHAEPDGTAEQNSAFTLRHGTNVLGPLATVSSAGWKATAPMQERHQYVVFRDVEVQTETPVVIEVAPGPGGVAVLNGLQIISRGTSPPRSLAAAAAGAAFIRQLNFREVHYNGQVSDTEARFKVDMEVEVQTTNEVFAPLFEGDVALIIPDLPDGLRIASNAKQYRFYAATSGVFKLTFELLAKITKAEPWNQISFTGPATAIATVKAKAAAAGVEMQLQRGTALGEGQKATSAIEGFLGADRLLSLRWQSKTAEITRKSLVTVDTVATAQITPTVIKYTTQYRYEILQAPLPRLQIELPAGQTLIRLQGDQIRDWQVKAEGGRQLLLVDFIKPVEKYYSLTLISEQALDASAATASLVPPLPLEVQRESGTFTLSADDMLVEPDTADGLRQINAASGAVAAYRFFTRPISVSVRLKRMEPVVKTSDRVTARLEEARLVIGHSFQMTVEKAGIYSLEMAPQAGFTVAEVKGEGIDDWKVAEGRLRINFTNRVLGARKLDLLLEQPLKAFPSQIQIAPLRIAGATNETAQIGAAAGLGIQLKTGAELTGLREIPITALSGVSDELLAFTAEQPDWRLSLATEKLTARVVAEVFNLVTIGDGFVGGSATVRYGLINQGVQEFKVRLPAHWKNVEFTGANIRRKEQSAGPDTNSTVWTITLQDKAWGGYTLVVTYDYQFNPKQADLNFAGLHTVSTERESGSLAVTVAGNLKVETGALAEPLREIDPGELSETDRSLITRQVFKAYRYNGDRYAHSAVVRRHEEAPVLDAVTDRTQITTMVTEAGDMLTKASFMVKNNDRQFQKFQLPEPSEFWAAYVNNQPVKAEKDGQWLLVSLPRGANRDEAFAVELVYVQKLGHSLKRTWPTALSLTAPKTDVPNTYAEWWVILPDSQKASGYSGNMTVSRGTVYGWNDAWAACRAFYAANLKILLIAGCAVMIVGMLIGILRNISWRTVLRAMLVLVIIGILAAIALPNFVKARTTAQRNASINDLRQLDGALEQYYLENKKTATDFVPPINDLVGTDKYIKVQPSLITYVGAGKRINGGGIIAYSSNPGDRSLLIAGGGIVTMSEREFQAALQRDAAGLPVGPNQQAPNAPPGQMAGFITPGSAGATGAGVRPVRIEMPRTGWTVSYTKLLNLSPDEPLKVAMTLSQLKVYSAARTVLQFALFVAGLFLIWRQFQSPERVAFKLALGWTLTLGSIIAILITWRLLHVALIAAPLALVFVLVVVVLRKWFRRARPATFDPPVASPGAAALVALGLLLGAASAAAQEDSSGATATNFVSLVSANYTGTVKDKVALFDVTMNVQSVASNRVLRLFGDEVAVQEFKAANTNLSLRRSGNGVSLRAAEPLKATLEMKIAVKLGGDVSKRQLAFNLPPALASKLALVIDEADADVEFPTAVAFQRATEAQTTKVEAVLGAGDRVEMTWTPRIKRATEVAASIFAQSTSLATLGGGVVGTRTIIEYQVTQGEMRQAKVRLPAGQRLLRVEGEFIRTWDLAGDTGEQTLTIELVKAVSPAWKLTLETERLLDKLPASVAIEAPRPLDVIRASGMAGVAGAEELGLSIETATDLQRLDSAEFLKTAGARPEGLVAAYRYLKPDFKLVVRAESVQPQIEATVMNTLRLGFERVYLNAQVDYTIKKAGVFNLRALVPAGYKIVSVTGDNLQAWTEKSGVVEATLKSRTLGNYTLRLALTRTHKELPKSVDLAGVTPQDLQKLTGFVAVSGDTGISLKTGAFEGLAEVPAATLPSTLGRSAGVLAYKFISTTPATDAPWKLAVSTEIMESWVRAEVVNLVTVTETLVSGRALVRFEIANAPVKEFRLKIPAAYTNVEIQGTDIRRRDQSGEEWRVELQNKTRGTYQLTVTWEQPRPAQSNLVETLGISAPGAERETGAAVLLARPPLVLTERAVSGELQRIDVRELPDWAGVSASPAAGADRPVLVYRYLRPGWKLQSEVRRFEEAAVLQALVDSAQLTSVVADDGQIMTEMNLNIRNNGRQYLEITLPDSARVWSAFVAGQPVRPSLRGKTLLLPLERSVDDSLVSVQLVYVGAAPFPKTKGGVEMESPQVDLPLKNVRWELYLPPNYSYTKHGGSMTYEASAAPVVQVFSLSEYQVQEGNRKQAQRSLSVNNLRQFKESLSSGKLGNNESYNYFRNADVAQDAATVQEFKALEKDYKRRQSSNLIQGQQIYSVENASKLGDVNINRLNINSPAQQPMAQQQGAQNDFQQRLQGQNPGVQMDYDMEVAEQQWERLERAQQVKVAKVQPLRANLPTRGQRLVFSQVLQTETKKPLTISFNAATTTSGGWSGRIITVIAAFLVIWIIAALWPARKTAAGY